MNEELLTALSVECDACHESFELQEALTERLADRNESIWEIGTKCPHCEAWEHSHYTSEAIDATREKLQEAKEQFQNRRTPKAWNRYKAIQREHQQVFDELQERMNGNGERL